MKRLLLMLALAVACAFGQGSSQYQTYRGTASGAVVRTVQDKLGDIVSVKDFGCKGDGSTDDTACAQAALASFPATGGTLLIPAGHYILSGTLTLPSPITLQGAGSGNTCAAAATCLDFAAGVTGIVIANTSYNVAVRNLFIQSESTGSGTDVGIDVRGSVADVENVTIKGFGLYGIYGDSTPTGYNADHLRVAHTSLIANKSHGFYAEGHDVNAQTLENVVLFENGGYGVYYNAGATNTLVNVVAEGNTGGGYYLNGMAFSIQNAYCEASATMVLAGTYNRVENPYYGACAITNPGGSTNHIFQANALNGQLWISPDPGTGTVTRPTQYGLSTGVYGSGILLLADNTDGWNMIEYNPAAKTWVFDSNGVSTVTIPQLTAPLVMSGPPSSGVGVIQLGYPSAPNGTATTIQKFTAGSDPSFEMVINLTPNPPGPTRYASIDVGDSGSARGLHLNPSGGTVEMGGVVAIDSAAGIPGAPPAGQTLLFTDPTDGKLKTVDSSDTVAVLSDIVTGMSSFNGRSGAVMPQTGDYTAAMVTNAVDSTSTYSDPSWLTALSWSKLSGLPSLVNTFNGRTGTVTPSSGDYTAAMVTNAVSTANSYTNPSWLTINSLPATAFSGNISLSTAPSATGTSLVGMLVYGAGDNFVLGTTGNSYSGVIGWLPTSSATDYLYSPYPFRIGFGIGSSAYVEFRSNGTTFNTGGITVNGSVSSNGQSIVTGYNLTLGAASTIVAPNGSSGLSLTTTCGTGQYIKSVVISGGVVTGATCGS